MNSRPDPDRADHEADDDVWRDLVARLRAGDPHGGPGWDDEEFGPAPLEPSAAERAAATPPAERADAADRPRAFGEFDPLGLSTPQQGPRDYEEAEGDGEFVPEEPEPVLAGADPASVIAWVGALGAPVALLLSALFWRGIPGYAIAGLVAAFIASVGFLIMRLPRDKDEDDDGARL
ncbi:hypothetical protein SPF06_19260 [Sinomonas sp. JGH33]|uniref:DUF308 domain-containing protein n=1 Tax=Sinomonas terricola TaxID=3110330 RepID=A0ABU5TBQ3_9MICC|nr:hypothetical protein [Sinomonas sp. JGH33]MEA5456866.1 hypothetical protein [Sinomonas sp. JGH33]